MRAFAFIRLSVIHLSVTGVLTLATAASAAAPGGFIERPETAQARPPLTLGELQQFLPERPGPFSFPPPYGTRGVRLTSAADCAGGDCVWPVGYSYWRNMNNHVGDRFIYFFLGLDRNRGGAGPTLFRYDKSTDEVRRLGPLFPPENPLSWRSGESWYFSATNPTWLYVVDGPRMLRYDIGNPPRLPLGAPKVVFDVTTGFGPGRSIWQIHSSTDDRVHSATMSRLPSYEALGCVVHHEDTGRFQFFPKYVRDGVPSIFDECAVDKSGRWAISLEHTQVPRRGLDMRVFDLASGSERMVLDQEGAVGHYDMGHGYVVGADNMDRRNNAIKLWDFSATSLSGRLVSRNDVNLPAPNHLSHSNAEPGTPPDAQYVCGSSAVDATGPWANEIICFRLDGRLETLVVAPVMTNMASAVGGDAYSKMPKGNLDVTGGYFMWTSNAGGSRMDAFLVKVPVERLSPGRPGGDPGSGPGQPQDVTWTDLVNVTADGNSLRKTGGCDGCQDAGAVSQQQITSGDGYMEFTASNLYLVRFVGLNDANPGTSAAEIPFAFKIVSGFGEIRENGVYRGDTRIAVGDRLRIAIQSGVVRYSRNGTVFYTSTQAPRYPLRVDTALTSAGGTIDDVVISSDR